MGRGRPLHGSDSSRDDALPFKGVMQGPPPLVRFACMHARARCFPLMHTYTCMMSMGFISSACILPMPSCAAKGLAFVLGGGGLLLLALAVPLVEAAADAHLGGGGSCHRARWARPPARCGSFC